MELILFSLFIIIIPLSILIFLLPSNSGNSHTLQPYPVIGNLPQFLRHRHRFLDWMTDLLAASPTNNITFRRLGTSGIVTANPVNVEHLLKTNFHAFPKGPRSFAHLHDFLGMGIFNVDGDLWHLQRKTASFEFNTRSLRTFVLRNVRHETLTRLLPLLSRVATECSAVDIQDLLERFAFDNVCKVAFNEDPACLSVAAEDVPRLSTEFARSFRDATELSSGRFRYALPWFWMLKRLLNLGSERRLKESIATVHEFAQRIIGLRRKEKQRGDDLLSRFMAEGKNTDELLRDIVISFILAGRDTTSSALTWFFWLLSSNPDVEQRILQEIRAVRARRGELGDIKTEAFDLEELREMHYIHAAISEAMRLYPPVPVNTFMCSENHVLPDGSSIKKGWFITYNAYAMGRMEGIWGQECREFKPERWLAADGAFQPESPYRYPVFHAGPRMCLGKEMAYIQMKSIIACVLERFIVEVVDKDRKPEKTLALTLRMKGGLLVTIRERCTVGVA